MNFKFTEKPEPRSAGVYELMVAIDPGSILGKGKPATTRYDPAERQRAPAMAVMLRAQVERYGLNLLTPDSREAGSVKEHRSLIAVAHSRNVKTCASLPVAHMNQTQQVVQRQVKKAANGMLLAAFKLAYGGPAATPHGRIRIPQVRSGQLQRPSAIFAHNESAI